MSAPPRSKRARPEIVIAGGGTAGHVLPALALAAALERRGIERASIEFIGARRGMETTLVPQAGYHLVAYLGRGVDRRRPLVAFSAIAGLLLAWLAALIRLGRHRPRALICVGGFAAVPASLAAAAWRVPIVVVNLDAVPGAANRLVARFAVASAVAFEDSKLPRAIYTGAPIREVVRAAAASPTDRDARREALGLDPKGLLIVVTGGSLGATRLNDAALGLGQIWRARRDLAIVHVSGQRDYEAVAARLDAARLDAGAESRAAPLSYRLVAYEEHLPELLAVSDLVLCRAGASTVAELSALGVPSVLVPLPGAPGDHQRVNARDLVAVGGALVVDDAAATPEHLAAVIEPLLRDAGAREAMGVAARTLGRLDAADRISELVLVHARDPR